MIDDGLPTAYPLGMLKIHGFSSSNYYNIVKLTLLEKDIDFEEVLVYTGAGSSYRPDYLEKSPLGKVPCLETSQGWLSESRCIVDYLERAYPTPALYPSDPFERAKLAELTQIIDLYLELEARRIIRNFFGRTKPPERVAHEVRSNLQRTIEVLKRRARLTPNYAGEHFSAADISAAIHFPMVRQLSKGVLDFDPLAAWPGIVDYLARLEQRPTIQRVRMDQRDDYPKFVAHLTSHYGGDRL
jgi:glutathione S-transferase